MRAERVVVLLGARNAREQHPSQEADVGRVGLRCGVAWPVLAVVNRERRPQRVGRTLAPRGRHRKQMRRQVHAERAHRRQLAPAASPSAPVRPRALARSCVPLQDVPVQVLRRLERLFAAPQQFGALGQRRHDPVAGVRVIVHAAAVDAGLAVRGAVAVAGAHAVDVHAPAVLDHVAVRLAVGVHALLRSRCRGRRRCWCTKRRRWPCALEECAGGVSSAQEEHEQLDDAAGHAVHAQGGVGRDRDEAREKLKYDRRELVVVEQQQLRGACEDARVEAPEHLVVLELDAPRREHAQRADDEVAVVAVDVVAHDTHERLVEAVQRHVRREVEQHVERIAPDLHVRAAVLELKHVHEQLQHVRARAEQLSIVAVERRVQQHRHDRLYPVRLDGRDVPVGEAVRV
eukprot:Unigene631_Nuclearia_a/m.2030 Unigene631_Nuclearia_a/g.2030  ORF Unigene631_Nuclearia_a/g.2030 Unigene631_Nuclearia_a/m.2030 type:complete len:402 (-) Unigene631_Nuclearia_a:381-1586(-)